MKKVVLSLMLLGALSHARADELILNPIFDGIFLTAGLGSAAVSEYLVQTRPAPELGPADISLVNGLDRLAIFPYSQALDISSTVLQYTAVAIPLLFGFVLPVDKLMAVGVTYLEALSYAYFAKDIVKYLIPRDRPWVYTNPALIPSGGDTTPDDSFFSGHATIAFTAAAFSTYIFGEYFPSSPFLVPFAVMNYALAALVASFRVLSGMHFITDVVTGAVAGFLCGYFIPFIHEKWRWDAPGVSFAVIGNGVLLSFRL